MDLHVSAPLFYHLSHLDRFEVGYSVATNCPPGYERDEIHGKIFCVQEPLHCASRMRLTTLGCDAVWGPCEACVRYNHRSSCRIAHFGDCVRDVGGCFGRGLSDLFTKDELNLGKFVDLRYRDPLFDEIHQVEIPPHVRSIQLTFERPHSVFFSDQSWRSHGTVSRM